MTSTTDSPMILDDTDKKILAILSEDARIPLVKLSEQIGLSRVATKARLTALEKNNVIEKYTLILNPDQLGHAISVSLDLTIASNNLKEVCEILKDNPYIHKLYQMTGNSSLHAHAMLPSSKHLAVFLQETIYTLPGLITTSCNTIIARIKDDMEIRI